MQEYGAVSPKSGPFTPVVVVLRDEKKPLLSPSSGKQNASLPKSEGTQLSWLGRIRRRALFWKDKVHGMFFNPYFYFIVLLVTVLAVGGWFFGRIVFQQTTAAKEWFIEKAPYSILWYYGVFCCGTVLLLPYGPFCLAVGFIFGVGQGCLIQIGAILISSAIWFSLGRYVFRDSVERWLVSAHPIWMTMLRRIALDWREAAKLNLLICFMPFPYGAHIFLFSISEVPFEQFMVFAVMGMMPYTFLELLAGHALSDAEHAKATHKYRYIGTATALVALLLAVAYAAELAQEVLEEAQAPGPADAPGQINEEKAAPTAEFA